MNTKPTFPFAAIVGQDELKLALLLTAVDPSIGGVLAMGDRGTGKSTIIRALAALLPPLKTIAACPYACDPERANDCPHCQQPHLTKAKRSPRTKIRPVPVIDLPLGASEDRVTGGLDLELALRAGKKAFEPGLLAQANRGYLYVDEVNLLEDHLVDLLIDVAASGENLVERDGLSIRHPARFVLVGSGNPEEGELRPQLLDRFGLSCDVRTPTDIETRVEIMQRRDQFERDTDTFMKIWEIPTQQLQGQIIKARKRLKSLNMSKELQTEVARICVAAGTDGLRGELTLLRTSRALAALEGTNEVTRDQLHRIATPALRHRLRRNPLDDSNAATRVARALESEAADRTNSISASN